MIWTNDDLTTTFENGLIYNNMDALRDASARTL